MSTRNLPGGKKRPARRADNLAAICEPNENVGASTSRNPKGLHGLYRDNFTFTQLYETYRAEDHCLLVCDVTFRKNLLPLHSSTSFFPYSVYSFTLEMEAVVSSKTLVMIYLVMWFHILEDGIFIATTVRTANLAYCLDMTLDKFGVVHSNILVLLVVAHIMNSFIFHVMHSESIVTQKIRNI
jgi:hypothetical protein